MFCYTCFTAIKEIPRQWKFQKHKTVTVTEHNFCFHPQTAQTSFFTSNFRFLSSRSDLATVAVTSTLTSLIKTPGLDDWPREKEQSGLDGEGVPYQAPATPPRCPRGPSDSACAPLRPARSDSPSLRQPTSYGRGRGKEPGARRPRRWPPFLREWTCRGQRPHAPASTRRRPLAASPSPHVPFHSASGKRAAPTPAPTPALRADTQLVLNNMRTGISKARRR